MGLFVNIEIDQSKFATKAERELVARTCPVDALKSGDEALSVDPENEDECIFCDRCVQAGPAGSIKVAKSYAEWLTRS